MLCVTVTPECSIILNENSEQQCSIEHSEYTMQHTQFVIWVCCTMNEFSFNFFLLSFISDDYYVCMSKIFKMFILSVISIEFVVV